MTITGEPVSADTAPQSNLGKKDMNPGVDKDMGVLAYKLWTKNHYARTERAPQYRELPKIIQDGWIAVGVGIRDELVKEWRLEQL